MIIKPEEIIAQNSLEISKQIFRFTPIIAHKEKTRIKRTISKMGG